MSTNPKAHRARPSSMETQGKKNTVLAICGKPHLPATLSGKKWQDAVYSIFCTLSASGAEQVVLETKPASLRDPMHLRDALSKRPKSLISRSNTEKIRAKLFKSVCQSLARAQATSKTQSAYPDKFQPSSANATPEFRQESAPIRIFAQVANAVSRADLAAIEMPHNHLPNRKHDPIFKSNKYKAKGRGRVSEATRPPSTETLESCEAMTAQACLYIFISSSQRIPSHL